MAGCSSSASGREPVRVGRLTLAGQTLIHEGVGEATISPRQADVLAPLMLRSPEILTIPYFVESLYGGVASPQVIVNVVFALRAILGELEVPPELRIHTAPGGYYLGRKHPSSRLLHFGQLSLDPRTHTATFVPDGAQGAARDRKLSPSVAQMLASLMRGAGRLVLLRQLVRMFGADVKRLRERLRVDIEALTGRDDLLVWIYGRGGYLEAPDDGRLRCWGFELDRAGERLVVAGHAHPFGPAILNLLEPLLRGMGMPVADRELLAALGDNAIEQDLAAVVEWLDGGALSGLVVAAAGGRRLALELLNPELLQVGRLLLESTTGLAQLGATTAFLDDREAAVLATVMRGRGRRVTWEELLGAAGAGEKSSDVSRSLVDLRSKLPGAADGRPIVDGDITRGYELSVEPVVVHVPPRREERDGEGGAGLRCRVADHDLVLIGHTLGYGGLHAIELGRKAARVLALLMTRAPALVTSDEIVEAVWPGSEHGRALLGELIAYLRRALAELHPELGKIIKHVTDRGYALAAGADAESQLRFGHLSLDTRLNNAIWQPPGSAPRELGLSPRRAAVLALLVRAGGRLVSKAALAAAAVGDVLDYHSQQLERELAQLTGRADVLARGRAGGCRLVIPDDGHMRCWGLELSPAESLLIRAGQAQLLCPAQIAAMECLMADPGMLVDDVELARAAWGESGDPADLPRLLDGNTLRELVTRTGSAHRIAVERLVPGLLQVGRLMLDPATGEATHAGVPAELTAIESAVLAAAMACEDRRPTKATLMAAVTGIGASWTPKILAQIRILLPGVPGGPPLLGGDRTGRYLLCPDGDSRRLPLAWGPIELDPRSGDARVHGRPLMLGARHAALLGLLIEQAGRVVSQAELMHAAWGRQVSVAAFVVCLRQLRAALATVSEPGEELIRTVSGRGYHLAADDPAD